ncbi:CPBP family intramembrane glutamic endopeptidase [Haloimpatiens sp. FM7330]|uniref:CPBP family intramembrane glutamic endopeptidase n=1 Tax=Haloimpatiens sp. FM7330 TaxID=3298610 RepID=UPI003634AFB2
MNIRIQCLDFMILFFTMNPTIIAQVIINGKNEINMDKMLKVLICTYVFVLCVTFLVVPKSFHLNMPKLYYWYLLAIVAVPIVIFLEICLGYLLAFLQSKCIKKIKLISLWRKNNIKIIILTALIGILEEIVYRQVWFYILLKDFKFSLISVLIITSVVYAFNHVLLGKEILFQKILSGLIYGCLFYFSGLSVVVPIITHSVQNIVILLKGGE